MGTARKAGVSLIQEEWLLFLTRFEVINKQQYTSVGRWPLFFTSQLRSTNVQNLMSHTQRIEFRMQVVCERCSIALYSQSSVPAWLQTFHTACGGDLGTVRYWCQGIDLNKVRRIRLTFTTFGSGARCLLKVSGCVAEYHKERYRVTPCYWLTRSLCFA